MKDWDSGRCQCFVDEFVSGLPARLLMAGVVEFHDKLDRKIIWVADNEVKVFALNAVERLLPDASAQTLFDANDIGEAHLAKNTEPASERLFKHVEEGALRRGEES